MMKEDYLKHNKEAWNKRTAVHLESEFYDNESFKGGRSSLNDIELGFLGQVEGKKILHLQCHFGQDTISLSRLGANPTGIDLSDAAIDAAIQLNTELNENANFVVSDVYDLPNQLNDTFDTVFTSYGTIAWLPDLDKWAAVIDHFLKPGGVFVMAEFHPVVWMFDDDFERIQFAYHNVEAIEEELTGTYGDRSSDMVSKNVTWNHGLAEVVTALLRRNLQLEKFEEYDYSPYDCLNGMKAHEPGKWHIEKMGQKLPLVYAIRMLKS